VAVSSTRPGGDSGRDDSGLRAVRVRSLDQAPGYARRVADMDGKPLDERLEEIGAQLAWVRDYL